MSIDVRKVADHSTQAIAHILRATDLDEAADVVDRARDNVVKTVTSIAPAPTDPHGIAEGVVGVVSDILEGVGQSAAATLVRLGTALLKQFARQQLVQGLEGERVVGEVDWSQEDESAF